MAISFDFRLMLSLGYDSSILTYTEKRHKLEINGGDLQLMVLSCRFPFRAFLYSNYILNIPTKCTLTVEYTFIYKLFISGPGSAVGIATAYRLDGPRIEFRWEARFSAPVKTGWGAQTASYTMGAGSFPGIKRLGRGVDHPPHLAPRLRKE